MGLFSGFKNAMSRAQIEQNGLHQGTRDENCDHCKYRMYDKRSIAGSRYLVCYHTYRNVGANQVCGNFNEGDPLYEYR